MMQPQSIYSYEKRDGIDSDHGFRFEIDACLSLFLRCKKQQKAGKITNYNVGYNLDSVGVLDDVVFSVSFNNENNIVKHKLVFMQLKHLATSLKEKPIDKILFSRRTDKKSLAELIFNSIIKIKSLLQTKHSNPSSNKQAVQQSGKPFIDMPNSNVFKNFDFRFEDCVFIYYTNAQVDKRRELMCDKKFVVSEPPNIIDNIINTSGSYIEDSIVLKLNPAMTEEIVPPNADLDAVAAFKENFYIYLNQEGCLENTINYEINNMLHSSDPNIYKYITHEFKLMFSERRCEFLNETSNALENILDYMKLFDIRKEVEMSLPETYDIFKEDVVEQLCKEITDNEITLLETNRETKHLEIIKFFQATRQLYRQNPNSLVVLIRNARTFQIWRNAQKTRTYNHFEKVFIFIEANENIITNRMECLAKNGKEHFLILNYANNEFTGTSFLPYLANGTSSEFSDIGARLILDMEIDFQDYPVKIENICSDFLISHHHQNTIAKLLIGSSLKIGPKLPSIHEKFVSRDFKQGNKIIQATEFVKYCLNSKFSILCDIAGMGKTVSLKWLCKEIKELHKNYWVIFIELKRHTDELKKVRENISKLEALNVISNIVLESDIERHIFKYCCLHERNVILFFDGFDEIFSVVGKEFIFLLKALSESNISSICVSSRPNYENVLCRYLEVVPTNIVPMSQKEQEKFIFSYLEKHLCKSVHSDIYQNAVHELVSSFDDHKCDSVLGSPLNACLISDICYDDMNQQQLEKDMTFDICKLYEKLIHLHVERYLKEKLGIINVDINMFHRIKSEAFKLDSGIWEAVACSVLYPTIEVDTTYTEMDLKAMCDSGIITNLDTITFMHRTFAEYLAAKYIAKRIHTGDQEFISIYNTTNIMSDERNLIFNKFLFALLNEQKSWKSLESGYHGSHRNANRQIVEKASEKSFKTNSILKSSITVLNVASPMPVEYILTNKKIYIDTIKMFVTYDEPSTLQGAIFSAKQMYAREILIYLYELLKTYDESNKNTEIFKIFMELFSDNTDEFVAISSAKTHSLGSDGNKLLSVNQETVVFTINDTIKFINNIDDATNIMHKRIIFLWRKGNFKVEKLTCKNISDHFRMDSLKSEIDKIFQLFCTGKPEMRFSNMQPEANRALLSHYEIRRKKRKLVVNEVDQLEDHHKNLAGGSSIYTNSTSDNKKRKFSGRKSIYCSPIHKAIMYLNVQKITNCLREKFNTNQELVHGKSPLHEAAKLGKKDIVDILLNRDVNVNSTDSDGNTPLHIAAKFGHNEIMEMLLNHEAYINNHNRYGLTPLHYSIRQGQKESVELLIKMGADTDAIKSNSNSISHHNARTNQFDLFNYSMLNSVHPNSKIKYQISRKTERLVHS
jgi:hypothetical protein